MEALADELARLDPANQPSWDDLQAWIERVWSKEGGLDELGREMQNLSLQLEEREEWGLSLLKVIGQAAPVPTTKTIVFYDLHWLREQCEKIFPPDMADDLVASICTQLRGSADEMAMAEMLGYEHLDLVTLILQHRSSLVDYWQLSQLEQQGNLNRVESAELMRLRERLGVKTEYSVVAAKGGPGLQTYPNVYDESAPFSVPTGKLAFPEGTERHDQSAYEEVIIPYRAGLNAKAASIRLIPIAEMEAWCRPAFPAYQGLNRMQSAVYPVALHSQENLLVCAPTGAGKTDVAMLAILRCLGDYQRRGLPFKMIYVAPMKALAAEIAEKFGRRLAPFQVRVRECTGDMQLTRQEIRETHMLVTTPEKWDVLTRHGQGDQGLVSLVRLLIIDEVHLLQDDRGPVIESLVARTLRLVETEQRMIRLVGLSATLPNYVDVALLLRVNLQVGLFSFDGSFRPVPLRQTFLGIKGKTRATIQENTNLACFTQMMQYLRDGHQVMIFVHARMETLKTARTMLRMASDRGLLIKPEEEYEKIDPRLKMAVFWFEIIHL